MLQVCNIYAEDPDNDEGNQGKGGSTTSFEGAKEEGYLHFREAFPLEQVGTK